VFPVRYELNSYILRRRNSRVNIREVLLQVSAKKPSTGAVIVTITLCMIILAISVKIILVLPPKYTKYSQQEQKQHKIKILTKNVGKISNCKNTTRKISTAK
jgi:hypothetical protein